MMTSRANGYASPSGRGLLASIVLAVFVGMMPAPAGSGDFAEQQLLVDKAKLTLEAFTADPSLKDALRDLGPQAKALFVIPQFMRGAFIFGGAGGSGVLLVREDKTGKWSQPVFYNIGSASFGLQVGGDVSEIVLVVRTKKGLEEFYLNDFKLGANTGMAVGPVGGGASVHGIAADIVSYAKKKGVFAGIAVEGATVTVSNDSNTAYYGKAVRPTDIILKGDVSNPKSLPLREAATKLMK
jgi:lipid-binding SYLF domain-containing protein